MTPERQAKFRSVIRQRQKGLTVILENVHDPHNIFAVMRTCDAVGVQEIFTLQTHPSGSDALGKGKKKATGKRSSASAQKWLDVHRFTDLETCMKAVRSRYDHIFATHLSSSARSLYALDLTGPVALLFGNEHSGLSEAILQHADGNFVIPQVGMLQSLNISVACAVTLYEAYRQRKAKGSYDHPTLTPPEQEALFAKWAEQ